MSVVVTHGGKIVHAAGYGRDSAGEPVTENTPMRVASISKSFTAMAVMTLVDDGRISLDEPVAGRLPEFRMADRRAACPASTASPPRPSCVPPCRRSRSSC
ncbi:serine hydrolase domain-containing protein [Streptosporangium sp. CA-115845]|uniref:serine hydrolase domain-containing protein n=1 Tax=Streptosporangium sp. CA-115845 TaxID=3240071 RepID=UPI003D924074